MPDNPTTPYTDPAGRPDDARDAPPARSRAAAGTRVGSAVNTVTHAPDPGEPSPGPATPRGGRYELRAEIARGGMGVVYLAEDTVLGRPVAVKALQERFGGSAEAARRFTTEAMVTGQLQHPAIPPVHDLGALPDGRPFLAMKLIRGRTLDALLGGRPDPAADRGHLLGVFEQVCQAVAYAHAQGIIHRDLKPHNVMVGDYGEVQVMDWGLAKVLGGPAQTRGGAALLDEILAEPADETLAGSVLGTPGFMPPEQARGDVDRLDRRSDVFGLGAILYAVLTGRPPFDGATTADVLRVTAAGDLGEALGLLDRCGAEPELVSLCARCVSPDPADRPADAGAVAAAVAALRADAELRARRAELDRAQSETRAAEQRKRWRVRVAALVILLGATALATVFAYWAGAESDRAGHLEEAAHAGEEYKAQLEVLRQEKYRREDEVGVRQLRDLRGHYDVAKAAFFPAGVGGGGAEAYVRGVLQLVQQPMTERLGRPGDREATFLVEAFHFRADLLLDLGERDAAGRTLTALLTHYTELANSPVATVERPAKLAGRCAELAARFDRLGKADDGRAALRAAVALYEREIAAPPPPDQAAGWGAGRGGLITARYGLAETLMRLGEYARAAEQFERLIEMGAGGAYDTDYAVCLAHTDPGRAVRAADRIAEDTERTLGGDGPAGRSPWERAGNPIPPEHRPGGRSDPDPATHRLFVAARVYSLVCRRTAGPERDRNAARAVALLRRLGEAGFFDESSRVRELDTDADFDEIRGRADFTAFRSRPSPPPLAPPPRPRKP